MVDLKDTENDSGFVNQEVGGGLYMLAALWKHSESSKEVWGWFSSHLYICHYLVPHNKWTAI